MDPSKFKILLFQVNDNCNFNCPDCHWFTGEVKFCSPQPVEDYLEFLKKIDWIDRVVFSGGEPTLWKDLDLLVNTIEDNVGQIAFYTNGSNYQIFENIKKNNIYIRLSIHKQTDIDKVKIIKKICEQKKWILKCFGYMGNLPENLNDFKNLIHIKINKNQVNVSDLDLSILKKDNIFCEPRMIYIGTDGEAYFCERGLRTKNNIYRMGFNLKSSNIKFKVNKCNPAHECLSCFWSEQFLHYSDKKKTLSAWADKLVKNII